MTSDEARPEGSESEHAPDPAAPPGEKALPSGRRVVRKRRKRKRSSRETVYLKSKEVLREPDPDYGAVGVKEQVERLRVARRAQEQKKPVEEAWGGRRSKSKPSSKWLLLGVFAILIPVLAIVTAFVVVRMGSEPEPAIELDRTLNFDLDDVPNGPGATGPLAWFRENAGEVSDQAMAILEELNAVESPSLAADQLRDSERVLPRIQEWGTGWSSPFNLDDPRKVEWELQEVNGAGVFVVTGKRRDFSEFRACFVKADTGLKFDWEGSVGWSEVAVGDLVETAPQKPVLVRVFLDKEPGYDVKEGPASLYSRYLLVSPDEVDHVWARVPGRSELDEELRRLLNYGMWIVERKREIRVSLRIVKPRVTDFPREFEIEELLSADWVIP